MSQIMYKKISKNYLSINYIKYNLLIINLLIHETKTFTKKKKINIVNITESILSIAMNLG